jgi:hypothetical protein
VKYILYPRLLAASVFTHALRSIFCTPGIPPGAVLWLLHWAMMNECARRIVIEMVQVAMDRHGGWDPLSVTAGEMGSAMAEWRQPRVL